MNQRVPISGGRPGNMDILTYTYDNGNKLLKVAEACVNSPSVKDFVDGTNTTDDYSYDANGNMTADANKGITSITYNHLNKPVQITGNGTVKNIYAGSGMQVDNTVTPRIDSNVHFAQTAPYAFQTLATPLRGHLQNSLYGDRVMLLNTDAYFPLFQTLIPLETPLQFVNLLQLGLFSNVATAKESWDKTAPLKGWLWSYGISARSTLASYPIRFDIAWPGTFEKKPVWYLSLSLK